jgi:hypothetical protein
LRIYTFWVYVGICIKGKKNVHECEGI